MLLLVPIKNKAIIIAFLIILFILFQIYEILSFYFLKKEAYRKKSIIFTIATCVVSYTTTQNGPIFNEYPRWKLIKSLFNLQKRRVWVLKDSKPYKTSISSK